MSRNYYSEINLHFVWHTKDNSPMLNAAVEPVAHRIIRKRAIEFDGVFVHALGGIEDHVHIAVTVPPTLTPSEFIGKIKGGSAHDLNHQSNVQSKVIEWQKGYGVVSFGTKDLEWVVRYIQNQREHHRQNRVFDRLERVMYDDDGKCVSDQANG